MTFIICSLWLPQLDSPQAATPGKLYTVQFSFSGFHSAFAPFTNSILINSQALYRLSYAGIFVPLRYNEMPAPTYLPGASPPKYFRRCSA